MINGPEQNTFLGEFAKLEGKILQHPLAEMNKEIKHQLINYLAKIEQGDVPSMHNEQDGNEIVSNVTNSRRSSRKTKRKECYDPSVIPAIQNELPGTKRKICFFCEDSIKPNDMAMECCGCRSWNHVCCDETLTMEFYNQLEDDTSIEYMCLICVHNKVYEIREDADDEPKDKSSGKMVLVSDIKEQGKVENPKLKDNTKI